MTDINLNPPRASAVPGNKVRITVRGTTTAASITLQIFFDHGATPVKETTSVANNFDTYFEIPTPTTAGHTVTVKIKNDSNSKPADADVTTPVAASTDTDGSATALRVGDPSPPKKG